MDTRKIVMGVAMLTLLQVVPSGAEFYQYKDQAGELHFTDNLSNVPEDQRIDIKGMQEIPPAEREMGLNDSPSIGPTSDGITWNRKLQNKAESLNNERTALEGKFQALQEEKRHLGASGPVLESHAEKRAQQAQVEALNRKIVEYEKQRKQFEKEVAAFNDGLLDHR